MTSSTTTDQEMVRTGLMAELVQAAASGDRNAWNELVDCFYPKVYAVARRHRLGPADAADVAQTTWLKLLEHLDRINHAERVGAWLVTTARRESLRMLRHAGREVATEYRSFAATPAALPSPDAELLLEQRNAALWEAFHRLPSRAQDILRLLMGESSISYRELSELLGMPVGSIGPTRQRYLRQLRTLIEADDEDFQLDAA